MKIDYEYLKKLPTRVGGCPGLYVIANENGDVLGEAWDHDEDVATLRILMDWYKRGFKYVGNMNSVGGSDG